MRVYYEVETDISGIKEYYFDGINIEKNNKHYFIDLQGEHDFGVKETILSGRFKGDVYSVEDLDEEKELDEDFDDEKIYELLKDCDSYCLVLCNTEDGEDIRTISGSAVISCAEHDIEVEITY